ncbi:hypothetical protein Q1695_001217 [Nippostrongylus brasiliensis]|nr:hypothetical protein Q1695_001217 [Nippostrongylus brasiliensis]
MIHYSAIYRFLGIHLELEFDHLQKFTVQPSRVVRRERLAPHCSPITSSIRPQCDIVVELFGGMFKTLGFFIPQSLSSVSPLIGIEYEDFARGCHLGVFRASMNRGDTLQRNVS